MKTGDAISRLAMEDGQMQIKLAKIQAKAEVKKARAEAEPYNVIKGIMSALAAIVCIAAIIAGCTVQNHEPVRPGNEYQDIQSRKEKMMACVAKGMEWDDGNQDCSKP